jgi:hypothetical protein
MSLTLRNVKGSPLTYTEMDDNLTYLEGLSGGTPSASDLAAVLVEGNITDGNNIVLSDGDVINAENGDGQLDLRYGGDSKVMLSTDTGFYSKEYLNMESGYIELSAVDTGGSRINMFADEYNAGFSLGSIDGMFSIDWGVYGPGSSINGLIENSGEYEIEINSDIVSFNGVVELFLPAIPTYADNAAAVLGGLPANCVYKTSTGELRIVV